MINGKVETVSVLIASFGPDVPFWNKMAARALGSVAQQTHPPDFVFRYHHDRPDEALSLGEIRNHLAREVESEWLCFLDADDELEPDYIMAMLLADGDVRYPDLRILMGSPDEKIKLPPVIELQPKPDFRQGNHVLVGAFIRRKMFLDVGGFSEHEACEDWALWLKAHFWAGATMKRVPDAIYRQHWREGSRNQMERRRYAEICEDIRRQSLNIPKRLPSGRFI